MNALTNPTGGAIASLQNLKQGLQNVRQSIPQTSDPFLRMGRDGVWVYGAENIEVEEGSQWAVNPLSLRHGYASWTDHKNQKNELVGEVMVPMTHPLPMQNELRDTGWPWAQQVSFQLQCVSGEDKGEQTLYKTVSVGGMNAVNKLVADIMAQLDKDPEKPIPLVTLDTDSYTHKQWGKTYVPIFTVRGWSPMTDAPPLIEDAPKAAPAAAPQETAQTRAAAPAQQEATTRRRRSAEPEAAPEPMQAQAATPAPAEQPAGDQPVRRRRRA